MALGVATHRNTETAAEAGLTFDGLGKKLRRECGLSIFIKVSKIHLIHQTAKDFLLGVGCASASFRYGSQSKSSKNRF